MKYLKFICSCGLLTAALVLVGCGQKGPLYIEDSKAENVTESTAS